MNRSYSEKVAGLFAIGAGIPLLIQGLVILVSLPVVIFYLVLGLAASLSGHIGIYGLIFIGLVAARVGAYIFDTRLVIGYFRHFQGKLEQKAVDRLWIKTIAWNGVFFFPSAYLNLKCLVTECYLECQPYDNCGALLQGLSGNSAVFIILTIWWGIATFVPFLALVSIEDEEPLP